MDITKILGDVKISLPQMLDARERRVARQKEMLNGANCLVSFTLNMPGEIKRFPLAEKFFARGLSRLKRSLAREGVEIRQEKCFIEDTGCEAFLALDADPFKIKHLTSMLEESSQASRLYDMDVLDAAGRKILRGEIGLPPRRCIICGRSVTECAPQRLHSGAELSCAAARLMWDEENDIFVEKIAGAAQRALLYEVCVSPKPGLVDRFNNGSHRDMDLFSFVDSVSVLRPYFRKCVELGIEHAEVDPGAFFQILRLPGMEAEDAMYAVTGGVNVHKGAIFSLGVLCAARGRLWVQGEKATRERLTGTIRSMLAALAEDFRTNADGVGRKIFRSMGVTGIRGEASAGFPSIDAGLRAFEKLLERGCSVNDAAATVLLHLICTVEDTNMIKRSSLKRFREIQAQLHAFLLKDPVPSTETIVKIDKQFILENLSPGGSADMLALTLMSYFWKDFQDEIAPI